MPGYSAVAQANSALSGNVVSILIGSQILAFAQTVGLSLPMGGEHLFGIGTGMPQEIQQLRMSPQISVDAFALTPKGVQVVGNSQNLSYLLAGNVFELHMLDGLANATILTFTGCKAQNFALSIPTNAIIRETFTFLAMDVLDVNGNSILNVAENAISVIANATTAGLTANNLGLASP